ncbi:MAG: hypothetical protein GX275_13730 [Clostridiales bacterium]|nr:hypothetical protein [Clostridiales bacterium]
MKNYEEMAESVFQLSGEIIAKRNKKRKAMVKVVSAVSIFSLVTLLSVGIFKSDIFTATTPQPTGNQADDIDGNHYSAVHGENRAENSFEENEIVYYSKLVGNTDTVNKDILAGFSGNSADIVAFKEFSLDDCNAIVEGKITNMYLKEYSFTAADYKYGEEWILTNRSSTVVYEIMVDKVWYGMERRNWVKLLLWKMSFYFQMKCFP